MICEFPDCDRTAVTICGDLGNEARCGQHASPRPVELPAYRCTWSRTRYANGLVYVSAPDGTPAGPILTMSEVDKIIRGAT